MKAGRLGILAGSGELPWLAARSALSAGEEVRIFQYVNEEPAADLKHLVTRINLLKFFSSVIRSMKKESVNRLMLLGKAQRSMLYRNGILSFDIRTLYTLARSVNQNDFTIFSVLAAKLAEAGITIISQKSYLTEQMLPPGRYGKKLNQREVEDVLYGIGYAREINRLDIGQTVVVGKKCVLAVECAEGTDRCIQRGGELFNKRGAVVCKTAKQKHDERFDIPVIGQTTLEGMAEAGCRVLAIDCSQSIVVRPLDLTKAAARLGITIISVEPRTISLESVKKLNSRQGKL